MTNTKKIKALDKTIALLSGPEGRKRWCKGDEALTKNGGFVDPKSHNAVRWCAIGAMRKYGLADDTFDDIKNFAGKYTSTVNDFEGRGAVLRMLRRYKKHLESK